jgi:uncharacterized membrane protein YhaH (DUF805 family)
MLVPDGSLEPSASGSFAAPPLTFSNAAKKVFSSPSFSGRASRSEFWYTSLIGILCWFFVPRLFPSAAPFLVFVLFSLWVGLVHLSVTVRRYHDVGRSGRWLFTIYGIPLTSLAVLVTTSVWMIASNLNGQDGTDLPAAVTVMLFVCGLLSLVGGITHLVFLCSPGAKERNRFDR